MESKALVRLEPLKAISTWDLPKDRRKEKEALESANRDACAALLRHDLKLLALYAGIFTAFVSMAFATGLLGAIILPLSGAVMTFFALTLRSQKPQMAANRLETTPSRSLRLQAGLEQDLIDSAFRINNDVFALNKAVGIAETEEVDERFRNLLVVKRESVAERLSAFDAMLGRYRLTLAAAK